MRQSREKQLPNGMKPQAPRSYLSGSGSEGEGEAKQGVLGSPDVTQPLGRGEEEGSLQEARPPCCLPHHGSGSTMFHVPRFPSHTGESRRMQ